MSVMSDQNRVTELLSIYRQAGLEAAAASAIGDHRSATRHDTTVSRVYKELRRGGPEATWALLDLCNDMHPQVRVAAATHALEFAPAKGEEILCELAVVGGPSGRAAEQALKDWRGGNAGFR
jgi:hypothetical protein